MSKGAATERLINQSELLVKLGYGAKSYAIIPEIERELNLHRVRVLKAVRYLESEVDAALRARVKESQYN